ncbi:MAG TPA: YdaS family helix-turn-helix protein [Ignavibacteriaceae bacterium]|nr:YdaS family helix-turn-helix protein [Ignavibacteriaceae bacterium]
MTQLKIELTKTQKRLITNTIKNMIFIAGSQKELAKRLGTSEAMISRWVSFSSNPSLYMCNKIKEEFGYDPEILRPDITIDWSKYCGKD